MSTDISKHIEFRPKRDGRVRPFVAGTRVEVSYLVTDSERHGMDADEIASGYENVSLAQVHAALAYYHDNREVVRAMIREDDQLIAELQSQSSGAEKDRHGASSPVSP